VEVGFSDKITPQRKSSFSVGRGAAMRGAVLDSERGDTLRCSLLTKNN
jgi:hypothetical protein